MKILFHKLSNQQLSPYLHFIKEVNSYGISELNSYEIRNILSFVFNQEIKNIILEDLFDINGLILSKETKQDLFNYLTFDDIAYIKNLLSDYLEFQINSPWRDKINNFLKTNRNINKIVIPKSIYKFEKLSAILTNLFFGHKLINWENFEDNNNSLILDYNQGWKKRNIFNINNESTISIFLEHFFKNEHDWKLYRIEKDIFINLDNKTRNLIFGEDIIFQIKRILLSQKPANQKNYWDNIHEEKHKEAVSPQEEIIIHYESNKSIKYNLKASFLTFKDNNFEITKAEQLLANPEKYIKKYQISNLENIINKIDLNELNKALKKDENISNTLSSLWVKYNLEEKNGKLWKQLLKLKTNQLGINKIYEDIEKLYGIIDFVSMHTFQNAYCNPKNETIIPREKKVFKAICQYLELPKEYRISIHMERILIGGHSKELNEKLKRVIILIIDNGIINGLSYDNNIINNLKSKIKQIEENIDMDYFGITKETLPHACLELCHEIKSKMKLKHFKKIEKSSTHK
jgi:uncharacterized protein (DUF1697 family)